MKLKKLLAVLSALCMMMTMSINGTGRDLIIADAVISAEAAVKMLSGNLIRKMVLSLFRVQDM